jgi:hypothetical protein
VVHLPHEQAAATSNDRCSEDSYAADISVPRRPGRRPEYATSFIDGSKKRVRNVPVSSRMMNENRAISPSRNDQWSGKTLFRRPRSGVAAR